MIFMRKKSFYVWSLAAALFMTACSDQNDNTDQAGEVGRMAITVDFEGERADNTRATKSTLIPPTSWSNIEQVQFFLYNSTGNVVYSAVENPTTSGALPAYANVPVDASGLPYTIVAVANAKSSTKNKIATYLDGGVTAATWDAWNVRSKTIGNLIMKHEGKSFPSFASSSSATAYSEPSEIFMAEGTVTISSTTAASVSLKLKREVSLMRVRVDVSPTWQGVQVTVNNDVNFAKNGAITIYRLPENMKIGAGAAGGAATTSSDITAISISGDPILRNTAAGMPAGYGGAPADVLKDNFTLWRDVVVFPNSGLRTEASSSVALAEGRKYYIVLSAWANQGHKYADGTTVTAAGGAMVHWEGAIDDAMAPNVIRDVNLLLRSGGSPDFPEGPTNRGTLTVTVDTPEPWNSNIVATDVPM